MVTDFKPGFMPAYLSNGVVGLRVPHIPLLGGLAILNGYTGKDPEARVEGSTPVPFPLATDIQINGVSLARALDRVQFVDQRYDFCTGELTSHFRYALDGLSGGVEALTFCSRSNPALVAQQLRLAVDQRCSIKIQAMVDPTDAHGTCLLREVEIPGQNDPAVDGHYWWSSPGDTSNCGIAYVTEFLGAVSAEKTVNRWNEAGPLTTTYAFDAVPDATYICRQITSLVPLVTHHEPHRQAIRLAFLGKEIGFDQLREENALAWRDLWRGRIIVHADDDRWQAMADAAFFYLHTSVHSSSPSSTSLFGLSRWHGYHYYRGHIMWDLEAFALPPLTLTAPEIARVMLEYRSERMAAARRNAQSYGRRGLQFPWESSALLGEESSPGESPGANHEQHVSLSVAFAFAQFVHATGDEYFLRERAWPILHGVAEWIVSRVEHTSRGYEIRRVTGIAEKKEPVDNNAFVNMAAVVVLREAVTAAKSLGYQTPPRWSQIADQMFVPIDSAADVVLNHDRYNPGEEKGETPEALAAFFPFTYRPDSPSMEEATMRYYLNLAHKYVGAPMLSAPLGVFAARLGERDLALEMFERGYEKFILEPFSMPDEYSSEQFPEMPRAGPFFANLGGFLTSLLYGLPGLRLTDGHVEHWSDRPVVLPSGWSAIECERIYVGGIPARLVARHADERARITATDDLDTRPDTERSLRAYS
ncbi:MAG: glycoside hydrolase family 65 protein [Chloroflexi bacterium]|nr:glycoside hydrolase family 65 protein [Chloroflexota bacterium]